MRSRSLGITLFLITASLALAACGAPASPPQTVEVTLTEFGIQSTLTTFQAGQTYQFVVTNGGTVNHEFVIFPAGALMEGHDMQSSEHDMTGALLHIPQDELAPGATVTVEYTFALAHPLGALEFACHLPGHYEAGMFTPIAIDA